ncbi:virulence factor MviN, partial [Streptomyces microflavus]
MSDTGTGTEAEALPRGESLPPGETLPREEAAAPLLPGPGQPPGSGSGGTAAVGTPPEPAGSGEAPGLGSFLARAAAATAVLTVLGAVLGLVRDQAIARYFGASDASDAFLIAWTVPEMAA